VAAIKTKATGASVASFLDGIRSPQIRKDARVVARMLANATKAKPKMWGTTIVGYGTRPATYADGRQVDWMVVGFAPRADRVTLYLGGLQKRGPLMKQLGPHSCGKGCLHIKRLSDVDIATLEKLVAVTVKDLQSAAAAADR
jgi:hypothetical protein